MDLDPTSTSAAYRGELLYDNDAGTVSGLLGRSVVAPAPGGGAAQYVCGAHRGACVRDTQAEPIDELDEDLHVWGADLQKIAGGVHGRAVDCHPKVYRRGCRSD